MHKYSSTRFRLVISSGEAAASTRSVTLDESLSFRMGWGHHVLVCFFLVYRISQVDHLTLSRSLRDVPLRPDSSLGELTAAVLMIFSGAGGMKSGEQASAVVLSLRGGLASSCTWKSSGECDVASGACLAAYMAWTRCSKIFTLLLLLAPLPLRLRRGWGLTSGNRLWLKLYQGWRLTAGNWIRFKLFRD